MPVDLDVIGEGPAVAGGRGEEPQELLGGRMQQRVAFGAEPLPVLRVLTEPLQGMRGQCCGGVEPTADDQAEVAQDLHVRRWFTVDAQLQQRVHQTGPRVLPDLHHVVDDVDAHLAMLLVDLLAVR